MPTKIAVVVPCYRVRSHILSLLSQIGPEVDRIFVIDDACPDGSGNLVEEQCADARVSVLRHTANQGVGAAVMTGYDAALRDGADVIVKLDGDGQMDARLIPNFVAPILRGRADYTKGNRFYDLSHIRQMPGIRLFGNAVLSFMAKLSTGYWNLFDINNGYTAIHRKAVRHIPFNKVSKGYFFETDLLFRLNIIRAVVVDIPMDASYGNESSSLRVSRTFAEFLFKHIRNFWKRVFYNYFLRDMTAASLELVLGVCAVSFGVIFGSIHWYKAIATDSPTPLGTIMLAALPTIFGLQLLLSFVTFDVSNLPRHPIHSDLPD